VRGKGIVTLLFGAATVVGAILSAAAQGNVFLAVGVVFGIVAFIGGALMLNARVSGLAMAMLATVVMLLNCGYKFYAAISSHISSHWVGWMLAASIIEAIGLFLVPRVAPEPRGARKVGPGVGA
jgi:uncharacterized membrane protein (UPF0136 family)